MEIFILWLGISLLVGVVGKDRKIGFGMAFLWAILLSPIIGLVIALLSDKKKQENEYISTRSGLEYPDERSENRKQTYNQERMPNSNDKKMSMKEWREKNPYKTINDYYREIGR